MSSCAARDLPSPPGVALRPNPGIDARSVRSVCAVVGSFDPLHRGHQWMVDCLLARFDAVVLLVPARHFSKTVCPRKNATLEQRLDMIQRVYPPGPRSRVSCGIANEVLFLRLAGELARVFPAAEICFGMGNDTHRLLLDSRRYFRKLGLAWGEEQDRQLQRLRRRVVVFGRSETGDRYETVPDAICGISSTLVRRTVTQLWRTGSPATLWAVDLVQLVSPRVANYIRLHRLYCSSVNR